MYKYRRTCSLVRVAELHESVRERPDGLSPWAENAY